MNRVLNYLLHIYREVRLMILPILFLLSLFILMCSIIVYVFSAIDREFEAREIAEQHYSAVHHMVKSGGPQFSKEVSERLKDGKITTKEYNELQEIFGKLSKEHCKESLIKETQVYPTK